MEKKLLEIIESHPNLENKEQLTNEVKYMFEQIRAMRNENQKLNEKVNKIIDYCLSS